MTKNNDLAIIQAASSVFMKHGYRRSNMSLISKQAGFSRVTIHKYLKNKDDAFRKCINQILIDSRTACEPVLNASRNGQPCWSSIEAILDLWITPTFEEADDHLILQELKYFAQQMTEDLFNDAHTTLESMLLEVIKRSVENKEISLEKLNISEQQLAKLIVASISGIRANVEIKDIAPFNHEMLGVFKVATKI